MLKVGITGGIGTGKSFVSQLFKLCGVPVYEADVRAKYLVTKDQDLKEKIIKKFGKNAYTSDGNYNTSFISSILFSDPKAKNVLDHLIHPEVLKDSIKWFDSQEKKGYPYALKEAALIYETGGEKYLDKVIVTDAPLSVRLERLKIRDQKTESELLLRMKNQWPQETKLQKADFIIHNDGTAAVIPQVYKIHQELIRLSAVHL